MIKRFTGIGFVSVFGKNVVLIENEKNSKKIAKHFLQFNKYYISLHPKSLNACNLG
jgi:hypothetical protein